MSGIDFIFLNDMLQRNPHCENLGANVTLELSLNLKSISYLFLLFLSGNLKFIYFQLNQRPIFDI